VIRSLYIDSGSEIEYRGKKREIKNKNKREQKLRIFIIKEVDEKWHRR